MDKKIITLIIGVTIVIFVLGLWLATRRTNSTAEIKNSQVLVGEARHATGSANAKITLVEVADFECPACGLVYPYVKSILEDYQDQIYYVYRHFPLPQHKTAFTAAEAAEAAGEQGKFWEMFHLLYQNQAEWTASNQPITKFTEYADQLGLDTDLFKKALEEHKFKKIIQADFDQMINLGIEATPTFYINGVKYQGDFRDLKVFLQKQLETK